MSDILEPEDDRIINEPLSEALTKRYLAYALSTITSRALPDVRDGLKPVQRRILYGMDEAQERAVLEDSIRTVEQATGKRIRGYLAPALTHTEKTLDLIAEYDFWYTCDLFQDDQPQPIKTKTGKLVSMPYSLEVNDVITYSVQGWSPQRYTDLLIRHFDQLLEEGAQSGTVMARPAIACCPSPLCWAMEHWCEPALAGPRMASHSGGITDRI